MWRLGCVAVVIGFFVLCGQRALAQDAGSNVQNLEGNYERAGEVDRVIEAQYDGLGLELPSTVLIDGHLPFPPRTSAEEDSYFIVRRLGPSDYVLILPTEDRRSRLADYGTLTELNDGVLIFRRSGVLTGEGNFPVGAHSEVRLRKEEHDGAKWLVVDTRIEWTKRSLFRRNKVEYRSLVRFREIAELP